jgi:hypothetical protein
MYKYVEISPHVCGDSRCGYVNSHWWFVLEQSICPAKERKK